jgi:outer membrane protein assembly factor BamE (lipoprotein component of BamABCDE complex)
VPNLRRHSARQPPSLSTAPSGIDTKSKNGHDYIFKHTENINNKRNTEKDDNNYYTFDIKNNTRESFLLH